MARRAAPAYLVGRGQSGQQRRHLLELAPALVRRVPITWVEPRRVVAALSSPDDYGSAEQVAFENHLNVFHDRGRGLDQALATGLRDYLNSQLVDDFVRQFSGHTQINATDLRELRYPSAADLKLLATGGTTVESIVARRQEPRSEAA